MVDQQTLQLVLNNLIGLTNGDYCNKAINPLAHSTFKELAKNNNYQVFNEYIPIEFMHRIFFELSEAIKKAEKNIDK